MTKRISHIAPVQLGTVLAVLYGTLALVVFVPLFLLISLIGSHLPQANPQAMPAIGMVAGAVIAPIFYAVFGFIGGVIAAFIYNLVAGWTGGIEFTLVDVAPAIPSQATLPTSY